jgi:hypothetical protein
VLKQNLKRQLALWAARLVTGPAAFLLAGLLDIACLAGAALRARARRCGRGRGAAGAC